MTTASAGGRRERNKAAKRARILAAANRLLTDNGYDGMTMAQVAETADVGIGTVFSYAATKPELLMMVTYDRWVDALPREHTGTGDPVERIVEILDPITETARREPELAMIIARELLFGFPGEHRDQVLTLVARLEAAVAAVLRTVAAPGGIGHIDAAARLVVSGAMLEVNRSRTGRAPEETMHHRLASLVQLVVAGTHGI